VCRAQYGCFCSSLILCLLGMLFRYCLNDFEMVPFASVITGITFAITFYMHWISIIIIITTTTTTIILVTTFMQGIYTYMAETNHVSRAYSVADVQYLQFLLQVILFLLWNMFCTLCQHFPQYVCHAQYGSSSKQSIVWSWVYVTSYSGGTGFQKVLFLSKMRQLAMLSMLYLLECKTRIFS